MTGWALRALRSASSMAVRSTAAGFRAAVSEAKAHGSTATGGATSPPAPDDTSTASRATPSGSSATARDGVKAAASPSTRTPSRAPLSPPALSAAIGGPDPIGWAEAMEATGVIFLASGWLEESDCLEAVADALRSRAES